MNEPPNSRYRAPARSGQPIVWMIFRSGLGTFQTSFTPSAHVCGLVAGEAEPVDRRARQVPLRPLREDRHLRADVRPRLEPRERLAVAAAALVAGARPDDLARVDEQLLAHRLRQHERARLLRHSARKRPSGERDTITLPWLRIVGGGGTGSARVGVRKSTDSPGTVAVRRHVARRAQPLEQPVQRLRVHHRAREQVRPGPLPFSSTATGTVPEPLRGLR